MSAHSFCLEKCGLDVTQPKCLIKSSLAPLPPSPPWIGKVQCNGVYAKHSGLFEHGLSGATNQRGNKITKQTQFRRTQRESMVCSWFPARRGGRTHQIRRIDQPGTRVALPRGGRPRRSNTAAELVARTWRCSSVGVRGQLPSNRMTKQTKFLIKFGLPDTYGEFGGLIVSFDRQLVRNAG